ncbi:MAG TPA: DNA topoisomerase, partial [Chthoniobacteraceae bacterium]|nr:DNA topoisomerase [Chthoniobacteraceae bacterium]
MSKTLVIAEKPSVAIDLAKALGVKKTGDFFENDSYVISSAVGHLLELAVPEEHEIKRGKWSMEKLPHLPPEFTLAPIDKNANRLAVLKRLLKRKDVSALVNACDAGREGELIFRNIVKATGARQPIRRLWLQSMTTDSIRGAFQHLRSDEEMRPLADAAVSRSEADWLVGINSTRALTAFNSQGGGFSKTTAGRVQTPTLAILVEREEKIRAFEPRTYFEVFGDFGVEAGSYRGRWFDPAFKKNGDEDARAERLWDKTKADAIKAKCEGKPGTIEEEKKPATQAPPLLYDLTTLQREANGRFGFPAKMTLQIAQALYEKHKVLTYPRTDSRYLPEDHLATAKSVMGSFEDRSLAVHAERALGQGWVRPNKRIFNNAKVSDHFAIVPTGTAPKALAQGWVRPNKRIFDNAKVSDHFAIVPTGTAPRSLSETEQKIF